LIHGVPVFPVFLSEIDEKQQSPLKFEEFAFSSEYPDVVHARGDFAKSKVESLRYKQIITFQKKK
jgi:hypothetical protein